MRPAVLCFFISVWIILSSNLANGQVNLQNVTEGCLAEGNLSNQCSGHGVCINSVCICDYLWSSHSDFIIVQDCTLSFIGVYILWGLSFLFMLFVYYTSTAMVIYRFELFFRQRKSMRGYNIRRNPGLISVMFFYFLGIPSVMIMSIAHFIDPTIRVGFEILPTVLFLLAKTGLYLGVMFFQGPLFKAALKHEPIFANLIRWNNRFHEITCICSVLVGVIPFITLIGYQNNIPVQFQILRAYYFSQASILFLQLIEATFVKMRLNHHLIRGEGLISLTKTKEILAKVNVSQNTIIKQALVQTIINLTLGSIPYLLNKHAYFLPLSWIAIGTIGKGIAMQVQVNEKTISIRQRLRTWLFQHGSFFEVLPNKTGLMDDSTMQSGEQNNRTKKLAKVDSAPEQVNPIQDGSTLEISTGFQQDTNLSVFSE